MLAHWDKMEEEEMRNAVEMKSRPLAFCCWADWMTSVSPLNFWMFCGVELKQGQKHELKDTNRGIVGLLRVRICVLRDRP